MWLFFGILGLIWTVSWVLSGFDSYGENPSSELPDGRKYLRFSGKRSKLLAVGIGSQNYHRFRFRKEHSWDTWACLKGFSIEIKSNDQDFDSKVYIESDSPILKKELSCNQGLRALIVDILCGNVREIVFGNKKIVAPFSNTYKWQNLDSVIRQNYIEEDLVPKLYLVEATLKNTLKCDAKTWADASIKRATFLSFSSWGLLLAGLFMFSAPGPYGPTIDRAGLWIWALTFSPLLISAVAYLWWTIMGRSSLRHIAMIDFLGAGAAGILFLTIAIAEIVNQTEDSSDSKVETILIDDSYRVWRTQRRGRGYWVYHLQSNQLKKLGASSDILTTLNTFDSARAGATIQLTVHAGYFNIPWVSNAKLFDSSGVHRGGWPGQGLKIYSPWFISR